MKIKRKFKKGGEVPEYLKPKPKGMLPMYNDVHYPAVGNQASFKYMQKILADPDIKRNLNENDGSLFNKYHLMLDSQVPYYSGYAKDIRDAYKDDWLTVEEWEQEQQNLPKKADGGNIKAPIKGTKEQYNRYNDSLLINKESELTLQELKKKYPNNDIPYGKLLEAAKYVQYSPEYIKASRRTPMEPSNMTPFYENIPYLGRTKSMEVFTYPKPVQPIIYQPEVINPIQGGHSFPNTGTAWNGIFRETERLNPLDQPWHPLISRYVTDKKVSSLNPMLQNSLESKNNLQFNPIPFTKGTYFTREQQGQEIGNKLDYFDKKTGKKLANGGQINELDMAKNGIYIKPSKRGSLRKALGVKEGENIPASKLKIKSTDSLTMKKKKQFALNSRKWAENGVLLTEDYDFSDPTFQYPIENVNTMGQDFITSVGNDSIDNTLYSDNLRMRGKLTPSLKKGNISTPNITQAPNFKQTIETPQINPWDVYNPQTGVVNQQQTTQRQQPPKFTGVNVNTFGSNKYFERANMYRNKAMESFSKIKKNGGLLKAQEGYDMGNIGNIAGGASSAILADINTGKGFLDIFGNMNQNAQVANWEQQQLRQSLFSDQLNMPPNFMKYGNTQTGENAAYAKFGKLINNSDIVEAPEMGGYFRKKKK